MVFSKYSKSEVECLHKMVKGNEDGGYHGIGSGDVLDRVVESLPVFEEEGGENAGE